MLKDKDRQPHPFLPTHFYSHGLTLVELIMAIAVFAILIAAGAPMLSNMTAGSQIETQANSLRDFMSFARIESITRRSYISICPRKAGTRQCVDGGLAEDWRNGWILYRDSLSSGGANILLPDSQIIRMQDELRDDVILTITGAPDLVRFSPRGQSSPLNMTFTFCVAGDSSERYAREVIISNGRVRMQQGEATSCL